MIKIPVCGLGQLPPRETAPRKITPYHKIFPKDNCRTQVNFPKRVLRMNWGELCIGGSRINFRVLQNFIKKSKIRPIKAILL